MSVAVYNFVGPSEVVELTELVMRANMEKAVNDASINIYKDFISITISNGAETTFYINYKYKQEQITDIFIERSNYDDFMECKDLLESLIIKKGCEHDN